MPVSIVVGGQYGSEGKGKVVHHFAKEFKVKAAVKVSGTNSGHTFIDEDGKAHIHRVLPSASTLPGVHSIIPAGAVFDPELLFKEMEEADLSPSSVYIHPNAGIITEEIKQEEKWSGLASSIGSAVSGTGYTTVHRILADGKFMRACEVPELDSYLIDTTKLMRHWLDNGDHIIIEGGQGFGLSLLHCNCYPFCTSRDTTASAFLSEAGLSPFDVTNVIQVLRTYEIRVGGSSGPMKHEITWEEVTRRAKAKEPIIERTSVTKKVRRVGEFDSQLVKRANVVNRPNIVVMNFMDYIAEIDNEEYTNMLGFNRLSFLNMVAETTGMRVTHVGFGPDDVRTVGEACAPNSLLYK